MPLAASLKRVAVVVVLALLLLALALRPGGSPQAASASGSPISGKCTGVKQGVIKGSVTTKGREGTYAITALNHGITTPRDSATGLPTGRRQHRPITFTMGVDQATPQFLTALTTNESLTCTFNFFKTFTIGGKTTEKNYFRVQLGGARVTDYSLSGRPGGADTVTFSLAYQQISWTVTDGGFTAADDWATPND